LINYLSDVRYVDHFQRYWRPKSKVVRNRAEIWTFFALPNFRGRSFRKLYTCYHPCLAPRRVEKFDEDIPTSPEVIGLHTLNFKPNFNLSRLQFFGVSFPVEMCARKACSISSACKILKAQHPLRAENIVSRKIHQVSFV